MSRPVDFIKIVETERLLSGEKGRIVSDDAICEFSSSPKVNIKKLVNYIATHVK